MVDKPSEWKDKVLAKQQRMITISVQGDDPYRFSLIALARMKGMKTGDLVRLALDTQFGTELEAVSAALSSVADPGKKNCRSDGKPAKRSAASVS